MSDASGRRNTSPCLHLLCGLVGSGKSTLARRLEAESPAVRLTLDEWMLRLNPELTVEDTAYGERATVVRSLLGDIAEQVLRTGSDAILDWNSWSRERRADGIARARRAGAEVLLHRLTTSLEESTRRARARTEAGTAYAHTVDLAGNTHLAGLIEEPSEDEGLRLIIYP
ncbi:ATP-binding protein [Brachybacterium paraconglomeratum]|uniref:AAA family ATPase n=1 Tax=Brachybacterium paraconglomeratum TaxID=173362 RepID=UPI00174DF14C